MITNLFKNLYQETGYIFRLDDIAPNMNWEMMKKVKNLFNKYSKIKKLTICITISYILIEITSISYTTKIKINATTNAYIPVVSEIA